MDFARVSTAVEEPPLKTDFSIFSAFNTATDKQVQSIYGKFLSQLTKEAREKRKGLRSLKYQMWTPPLFVHCSGILYGRRHERHAEIIKGCIHERGHYRSSKGRAILQGLLSEWLLREPGSADLLLYYMKEEKLTLEPSDLSKNTKAKARGSRISETEAS